MTSRRNMYNEWSGLKEEEDMEPSPRLPLRKRSSTTQDLGVLFESPDRTATTATAVFNLVSTIVGGGVLSLPFAISVQGVFGGLIALLLSAIASDFSIYILIASSRSRGARGYEDVAAAALGESARIVTVLMIFALTFLVSIAYIILCADLLSALVDLASHHQIIEQISREYVILGFVVAVSPLAFFRKMDALRFTSILSVCSVFALGVVTAYKLISDGTLVPPVPWRNDSTAAPAPSGPMPMLAEATMYSRSYNRTLPLGETLWWPSSIQDYIYALPIESVAFLCHFNVLPMQDELVRPTRRRVQRVTHTTIYICVFLYTCIAMTGYFRFTSSTCGDYLNNFLNDDPIATIGRVGLLLTLYCSFPLLVLPCRATFSRLMDLLCCPSVPEEGEEKNRAGVDLENVVNTPTTMDIKENNRNNPLDALLSPMGSFIADSPHVGRNGIGGRGGRGGRGAAPAAAAGGGGRSSYGAINFNVPASGETQHRQQEDGPEPREEQRSMPKKSSRPEISNCRHITLTCALIVSVCFLALKINSVVTIWSIAGSSVAMMISYVGPSLFYIRLRRGVPCNARLVGAWFLLIVSLVLIVLCSWQAVMQLDRPNCPLKND